MGQNLPHRMLSVSDYHNPDIFRKLTCHLCTATEWCNTTNQNSPVILNKLVCTYREFDDCNVSTLQTRGQRQKLMHVPIITNEADYIPSACNGSLKTYSPSGHPRFRWVCFFTSAVNGCRQNESSSVNVLWSERHLWNIDCLLFYFFISCLDSHSDGTHSLERIHWWASDVIVKISPNLFQLRNKLIYILSGLRVRWSK